MVCFFYLNYFFNNVFLGHTPKRPWQQQQHQWQGLEMQQTRLEPHVSFLFYFTISTLMYFLGPVMATTAAGLETQHVSSQWYVIYIYITLIFLGPIFCLVTTISQLHRRPR